jgi:hypothetical protein
MRADTAICSHSSCLWYCLAHRLPIRLSLPNSAAYDAVTRSGEDVSRDLGSTCKGEVRVNETGLWQGLERNRVKCLPRAALKAMR